MEKTKREREREKSKVFKKKWLGVRYDDVGQTCQYVYKRQTISANIISIHEKNNVVTAIL